MHVKLVHVKRSTLCLKKAYIKKLSKQGKAY